MDAQRARELDLKEEQKIGKLVYKIIGLDKTDRGSVARLLFPEIPWIGKFEDRGHLYPFSLPPWLALPFYEKPILVIEPVKKEAFKMIYGLTSEELLELLSKRRIYATIRFDYKDFVGEEFNHLDCILEKGLPTSSRWLSLIEGWLKKEKKWEEIEKLKQEARSLDPEFGKYWDIHYAILSSLGMRRRLVNSIRFLSFVHKWARGRYSPDARALMSFGQYRKRWLDMFYWEFLSPYFFGAVPVTSWVSRQLFSKVFRLPAKPEEGMVHEVAQDLLIDIGFVSAANPKDLDIDLVIKTQDHAKDFRKAYKEFMSLVWELKLKEALETRDAIAYASEKLKRSSPILDKTKHLINGTVVVSTAALTAQALNLLVSSGLISLIPGGVSGSVVFQVLRKKEISEWLEGKYASLLHRIGVGPFALVHTWRAQKIVERLL